MDEKGVAHVWAALGYSMAGARVLFREEAARLEIALLVAAFILFLIAGADLLQYVILAGLFMALICIEALNTAIELIVDRISPEISDFGKQAKDIGSFAVFCGLVVFSGYALLVVGLQSGLLPAL